MLSHHISLALAREHQRDLLPDSHRRAIPAPQTRDIVDSRGRVIPDPRRAWRRLRGLTPADALCELNDARLGRRGSSVG
jgi:hypothetical protein